MSYSPSLPGRTRRAVLYCTVNGIANNTNGLGRQTKTLLATLDSARDRLIGPVGPFDVHLAGPSPDASMWAYDRADLDYAVDVTRRWGGAVHGLPYSRSSPFWSPTVWWSLCQEASALVRVLARTYSEVLVLGVDTPFLGLPEALASSSAGWPVGVRLLLVPYSTARIVERPSPDPMRVAWEQRGLDAANVLPQVWVADVGRYLSAHLQDEYGLSGDRLVPFPSSLHLGGADLQSMPRGRARSVAAHWGVPVDRPIVLTIGRTDPTKGIDVLLDALASLREDIHAVVVAVPLPGQSHLLETYRGQVARHGLRVSIVDRFSRDLPRALCALPVTKAVACPSRGETLANVPFEVALWGQHAGPVVVAPARDGFVEQIEDGVTGLLYDPAAADGLTAAIRSAVDMGDATRRRMATAAFQRVRRDRDAVASTRTMLLRMFSPSTG